MSNQPWMIRGTLALVLLVGCGDQAEPVEEVVEEPAVVAEPAQPALPSVMIVEPAEGAQLAGGDVRVSLMAHDIVILPAGDSTANSGHHHLFLNVPTTALGEPIPAGQDGIVHLGQAQTEYTFEDLAPGEYTLVATLGDLAHRVLPQVSDTTRFTVTAAP